MKIFSEIWSWLPKKTPKNTIMWIQVPMSVDSKVAKDDVIFETMNHLERTIKINNNVRIQAQSQ